MKMSEERLTKLIKKMINVIKPNGVSHIEFRLEPIPIRDDEYYIILTYIVPDDSEYLAPSHMRSMHNIKYNWNYEIRKSIKDYFNTVVIVSLSNIASESYYNSQK
jgi:hypothetical protein